MTKRRSKVEVAPGDNGWTVDNNVSPLPKRFYRTKKDAVSNARTWSKVHKSELIIKDKSGKIQKKDSHGNDPFPPRG